MSMQVSPERARSGTRMEGALQNRYNKAPGLLVLHAPPQQQRLDSLQGIPWRVLSFLQDEDEKAFLDSCDAGSVEVVEVIKAAHIFDGCALRAREKYCTFTAEWPERYRRRGRSFKEMFTYRGELAYWWLTDASMKDNEVNTSFEYLCHLEVFQEALRMGAGRCVFYGKDPMTALLVGRACASMSVPFHCPGVGAIRVKWGIWRGLAARLWFAWCLLARLVVFRTFFPARPADGRPRIAFYTLFPTLLRGAEERLDDRNYAGFPEYATRHADLNTLYLATFSPASLGDWRRLWTQRKDLGSPNGQRLVLLESYLRFTDLALVMSNLVFVFWYLWLNWTDRGFRESFQYDGINIYELVGPEYARSFLGNQLPAHLVLTRLVERAVRDHSITHLGCFLELYATARAVYYGAKRGRSDVANVAYQHANINRLKLWYSYQPAEVARRVPTETRFVDTMPLPDQYLFQGENGMRVVLESGYPQERCHVTGSPRYDALGCLLLSRGQEQRSAPSGDSQARTVLVIPSLSEQDADELVEMCVRACAGSKFKLSVQVKPHPSSSVGERVPLVQQRYAFYDVEVVEGALYELIENADVVVTSYSTAGDEAIALGCPVVCYAGLRPSMSSFLDIPAAPVVHDAGELLAALERMIDDPEYLEAYRSRWPDLIEGSFHRLDAQASPPHACSPFGAVFPCDRCGGASTGRICQY